MTKLYAIYEYLDLLAIDCYSYDSMIEEDVSVDTIIKLRNDPDVRNLKVIEGTMYPQQSIDKLTS